MMLVQNGDNHPIPFFLAQAADHHSPATGLTVTPQISKNGAAFGAPSGAVSEVGLGWYIFTPSGADVTTNGALLFNGTATGADPANFAAQVVAFNPYNSTLGVLTTQMTESYAALHAAPTLAQAILMIQQVVTENIVSGTAVRVNKLDGSTQAAGFLINANPNPASITRNL